MPYVTKVISEPSSYAGLSGLFYAVPMVIADPLNITAWATIFASLAAILKTEAHHA